MDKRTQRIGIFTIFAASVQSAGVYTSVKLYSLWKEKIAYHFRKGKRTTWAITAWLSTVPGTSCKERTTTPSACHSMNPRTPTTLRATI